LLRGGYSSKPSIEHRPVLAVVAVWREREMGPTRGEGAGMASGADAHISIVDNHARFKSERLRAGGSGELLARRQETAYITWPSTHAV